MKEGQEKRVSELVGWGAVELCLFVSLCVSSGLAMSCDDGQNVITVEFGSKNADESSAGRSAARQPRLPTTAALRRFRWWP